VAVEPYDVEAALRDFEQNQGYVQPIHRYIAENDLHFFEIYNTLVEHALNEGKAEVIDGLQPKYREIVILAILAFRAGHFLSPNNALIHHIQRALQLGATRQEVFDTFKVAILSGGAPTFLAGVRALQEAEAAMASPSPDLAAQED
jgi:alkylhydroperoxidase/carboxymuconolactone decarboxylase family protein YurZ